MQVPIPSDRVRFDVFEVKLRSGELHKHGIKVKLHHQPFQILAMLLEHPGEVVTREQLRQKLWPVDTFVDFDVGLNSVVKKLRDALGDSAETPRFVETLPRRGYRFIALVESEPSLAGAGGQGFSSDDVAPEPAGALTPEGQVSLGVPLRAAARSTARRALIAAIALAALIALLFGLNVGGWRERLFGRANAARIQSIAVLPLENLTGDPSQDYIVEGVTDALTTELAQIKALRVISRTSAMQYKGAKKPLPQIARELNVDAVVEGTVRRIGDRVWITPQLIEAATDRHLWAKPYERNLREVPTLQNQVAQDIVREMRIELTAREQTRLAGPRPPVNLEAYEAYLQGRYYWNKRTEEGLKKSVEYFQQAIRLDPNYALAYAGLADSYNLLGYSVAATMPLREAAAKARAAALKALELDAGLGEVHAALGYTEWKFDWDWAGAEKEFQRAIELSPSYATAYHWYSLYQLSMGRPEEALTAIRRAQQLDPFSPNIRNVIGGSLATLGRYDEAIAQLHKAIELDPSHYNTHIVLGDTYLRMKKFPEATAEHEKAVELSGGKVVPLAHLAYDYALFARRAEAEKLLVELKRRNEPALYGWYARICTALGRKDEAFVWLEKAFETHSGDLASLRAGAGFEPLHSDPRFKNLLRRMNFPEVAPRK